MYFLFCDGGGEGGVGEVSEGRILVNDDEGAWKSICKLHSLRRLLSLCSALSRSFLIAIFVQLNSVYVQYEWNGACNYATNTAT